MSDPHFTVTNILRLTAQIASSSHDDSKWCVDLTASRFDIIITDVFNTRTEMEIVKMSGATDPNHLPGGLWDVLVGLLEVIQVADIQYFTNRVLERSVCTNYSTSKWF